MKKIGFLVLHVLFAACQIVMPILGLKLISLAFYIAGGVVVIFGLLSFLPGVKFWTAYTKYGSRYEENNIVECFITLCITVVIGGAIAYIPQYLNENGLFVPIFTYLLSIFIGLKIMAENSSWSYLGTGTRILGKLVPCVYILAIAVSILPLINPLVSISPVITIVLMSIAGAFHLFRTILVVLNDPF